MWFRGRCLENCRAEDTALLLLGFLTRDTCNRGSFSHALYTQLYLLHVHVDVWAAQKEFFGFTKNNLQIFKALPGSRVQVRGRSIWHQWSFGIPSFEEGGAYLHNLMLFQTITCIQMLDFLWQLSNIVVTCIIISIVHEDCTNVSADN